MTINIDFEGLNKIFCKLGLHRWYSPEEYSSNVYMSYGWFKIFQDCGWEKKTKKPK